MVLVSSVCYRLYLLFVLWLLTGTFKLNLHHEFENEALNFIKSDHLFAGCYPLDSLFRDLFDHTLMRRTGVALVSHYQSLSLSNFLTVIISSKVIETDDVIQCKVAWGSVEKSECEELRLTEEEIDMCYPNRNEKFSRCDIYHPTSERSYWLITGKSIDQTSKLQYGIASIYCGHSAFLALGAPIFVTLISNYGLRRYIARLEKREKDLMMQLRRQNQNEQNSVKLLLSLFGVR